MKTAYNYKKGRRVNMPVKTITEENATTKGEIMLEKYESLKQENERLKKLGEERNDLLLASVIVNDKLDAQIKKLDEEIERFEAQIRSPARDKRIDEQDVRIKELEEGIRELISGENHTLGCRYPPVVTANKLLALIKPKDK